MSFPAGSANGGPVNIIAKAYDDLRVDGLSTMAGATAPSLVGGFAGNANIYNLRFAGSGTDYIYFSVQFPHSTKVGSICYPHVHISPSTTGTGNIEFELEYSKSTYPGIFGASQTYAMNTSIDSANQWSHIIAAGTSGIITNGMSEVWACRITRNNAVAGNYADPVCFIYFDIHFEIDAFGSQSLYIK